jgi:dipeptidyl aminopeptidase/acylaminoacyl peptidase
MPAELMDGKRSHLFVLPVKQEPSRGWQVAGEPLDLMKGVDADCPTKPFGGVEDYDWSPDGQYLLFTRQDPVTLKDLWALPLFGDRKAFPILQTQFLEEQAHISPDGQWIAFVSNESGKWEVYLQRFPRASGKWPVSTAGGSQPRWRRDGREIYFVDPKSTLYAVGVNLGAKVEIGQPRSLFPISLGDYAMGGRYAATADGDRFLVNVDDTADTQAINVVLNWPAALKK